jgi:hypothetical protein
MAKTVEDLVDELKEAVAFGDNEAAHGVYDDILKKVAKEANPKLVQKLDRIVKGTDFWYA